jgi:hypothetical protein
MKAASRFLTFNEVLEHFKIRDFEILEYLRKGLQPYSKHGIPLKECPYPCDYLEQEKKRLRKLRTRLKTRKGEMWADYKADGLSLSDYQESEVVKLISASEEKIHAREDALAQWYSAAGGDVHGWENIIMPYEEEDREELISALRETLFLREDVLRLEQKPSPSPAQKLRPNQRHRLLAMEKAQELWKADPTITIQDMGLRDEINELFEGRVYVEATMRKWLKDVCPNRKPGRRSKPSPLHS